MLLKCPVLSPAAAITVTRPACTANHTPVAHMHPNEIGPSRRRGTGHAEVPPRTPRSSTTPERGWGRPPASGVHPVCIGVHPSTTSGKAAGDGESRNNAQNVYAQSDCDGTTTTTIGKRLHKKQKCTGRSAMAQWVEGLQNQCKGVHVDSRTWASRNGNTEAVLGASAAFHCAPKLIPFAPDLKKLPGHQRRLSARQSANVDEPSIGVKYPRFCGTNGPG